MTLFGVVLVALYLISYNLMKNFLLQNVANNYDAVVINTMMVEFNFVCIEIAIVSFILFLIAFYVSKKISDRVSSDVIGIKEYLEDINAKDYESVLKIEHYVEFLEISLLLKNIVKRLKQKDKKS